MSFTDALERENAVIDALLVRCRKAEGPDREIDQEVAVLLGWSRLETAGATQWLAPYPKAVPEDAVPSFSGDASLLFRVIERHLSAANCFGIERTPIPEAYVSRNNVTSGHWLKEGFGATPELALLAAFLLGYRHHRSSKM